MNIITFTLVCTVFWVFTIFIALPIGITTAKKTPLGHADSAPIKPRLGLKLLITFAISIVLTLLYWYIIIKFPHILDFLKD